MFYLFTDYFSLDRMVGYQNIIFNGGYNVNQLLQFRHKIKEKRAYLIKKKALFYKDNAPVLKSSIAITKIHKLRLELVPHLHYSSDFAPSDYHLFTILQKRLGDKRFSSNNGVIAAVNSYFEDLDLSTYNQDIANLEFSWNKCVERASSVEK